MLNRLAAARRASSIVAAVESAFCLEGLETRRLYSANLSRIGDVLGFLANDFSTRPAASQSRSVIRNKTYILAAAQPNAGIVQTLGDTVLIKAVSTTNKLAARVVNELQALGATVTGSYGPLINAAVPVSKLASLASLSGLNYADAAYAPHTSAGKTDDFGATAERADTGAKQYNVDGTGVRVGVLSDSYAYTTTPTTAAQDVASGDLPSAGVTVVKDDNSTTNPGGDFVNYPPADEGRAMSQIVHDVAPGAAISFYTADVSEADFATGITTLAKPVASGGQGAQVVVDDVAYYDEPFFQDGIVAQAVNNAYTNYGTSYFSAAGNEGRQSYESNFNGFSTTVTGAGTGTFQDFDPSAATNAYQQITIPAGGEFYVVYQWDSPFSSASVNAGNTAASGKSQNSVSLYLINAAKTGTVATATTSRINGDAYQILDYVNTSTTTAKTVYLTAKVASGTAPGFIKYIDEVGGNTIQYATNSGTNVGHSAAAGGLGVGAAYWGDTPAFNTNPAVKESYSSSGGSPILFSTTGTRLASATYRNQPAIVAPDGAATTFFYGSVETTTGAGDNQYHFYGTSAAAPHAAGVAALLLQAKSTLTNAQVYSTLETTALDMGTAGYDSDNGFGLIQADKALAAVAGSSISGKVYKDLNANGTFDGSDTGVSGQTVFLDSNSNGVADSSTTSFTNSTATAIADSTATTSALSRTTSAITSTATGRVTNLTVSINVTHARASDLDFALLTPAGIRIPLLSNLDGISGNAGTGFNLTLSDAASTYIQGVFSSSVLTGTYKPQSQLAAAIGESAAGTWTLEARDAKSGSTGTINSWSLGITSSDPTATTDANGNYSFTALTPSAFYGTYHVRTGAISGFALTTPAGGYDLTLARSTTSTGDNLGFTSNAPLSTVATLVLDDGTVQRSNVRSVTVTLNGTVTAANIGLGAFTLVQNSGPVAKSYVVNVSSVTPVGGTQSAIKLVFAISGTNTPVGVVDGRYTLSIDGSKITDSNGLKVDANNTGVAGSIRTYNFLRLNADADGSGTVDFNDFLVLQNAFNSTFGGATYNSGADNDANGTVDFNDFLVLQNQFNHTV